MHDDPTRSSRPDRKYYLRFTILSSTTTYLSDVVVMDIEGKYFHATVDGKTKKSYNFSEYLAGKHLEDHPGYDVACEAAHMAPKPASGTDRGAQPFTEEQRNQYIETVKRFGRKHWLFPGQMAPRVMTEMASQSPDGKAFPSADACIAWWHYCDLRPKVRHMVIELRPITDKDRRRHQILNECRLNSSNRIDFLANIEYVHPEVEKAREYLTRAMEAGALSPELCETFGIKILKAGKRKGLLVFDNSAVMTFYVVCCDEDGKFRRDAIGNRIGLRSIIGGILQHHAFKSGKGSNASARAKTRMRLLRQENNYRDEHGIEKTSYPAAIPSVRKHHQAMNRQLVRVFRDYAE